MKKYTLDIILDNDVYVRAKDIINLLEIHENLFVEPIIDFDTKLITGLYIKNKEDTSLKL